MIRWALPEGLSHGRNSRKSNESRYAPRRPRMGPSSHAGGGIRSCRWSTKVLTRGKRSVGCSDRPPGSASTEGSSQEETLFSRRTDGDVEAFLDEVHRARRAEQLQPDFRVALEKVADDSFVLGAPGG